MNLSPLFEIAGPWPGNLAIAAAPAPDPYLEANLEEWRRQGVTGVLSLLCAGEWPGLRNEEKICRKLGMEFYSLPVVDHKAPAADNMENMARCLESIETDLGRGKSVAAHCYAGIGRSGMASTALLMIAGIPLEDARALVGCARGLAVPENSAQREWLSAFDRYRSLS